MTVYQMNKIMKQRGYLGSTLYDVCRAYLILGDEGIDITLLKKQKPIIYVQRLTIIINTASTNFIDSSKPFFGLPLDVIKINMLKYLDLRSLGRMAKVCKRFYSLCMKYICSMFPSILEKLINKTTFKDSAAFINLMKNINIYWRREKE